MVLVFASTNDDFFKYSTELSHRKAGGFVCFNGRVRQYNHGKEVAYLYYEAHAVLAQSMFAELTKLAQERYQILQCAAVHRLRRVEIGENAVSIAVAAVHRQEAFAAAAYLIDELKKTLPIWKKEVYVDGTQAYGQCTL